MKSYTPASARKGLRPCGADVGTPLIPKEEFARIKAESVKIYAYANRIMRKACEEQRRQDFGYALFDKNGWLLKLYGPEGFPEWCAARGICLGSRWDMKSMGHSAVSIGLRDQAEARTCGPEHDDPSLGDVEIHFAPLLLESKEKGRFNTLGGLALFAPADAPVEEGALILDSLANDIILHIFMAGELYDLYFQEPKGLVNIDINRITGKYHILYHNDQLFRTLGIPYENLYFQKAETLFDPLPKNQRFWDIIQNQRIVEDEIIPLSVRGREATYQISNALYQQSKLGVAGIRFFVSSPQVVSSHVARHIGNNAVYSFPRIIGQSPAMQRCIARAKSIARSDSNVMITGESGVGKDIFAQAIHNASRRKDSPFIVLNCAAYPRDLLASELFGYDGGAYTGAKKNGNLGKFELADTGTIFLDEIGDMPLDLQVMLLRVIEQKTFSRIGSNVVRSVDVKIISATNADLQDMVEKRTFRPDLYFRLCTLNLRLPPLRERGQDIVLLGEHFIDAITARLQMPERKILADETKELMLRLPWSGNVRELQNVIERVVQLVPHQVITPRDLEQCLDFTVSQDELLSPEAAVPPRAEPSSRRRTSVTREEILRALEECKYNRTLAAYTLGISRKTFYRKLEELQIEL